MSSGFFAYCISPKSQLLFMVRSVSVRANIKFFSMSYCTRAINNIRTMITKVVPLAFVVLGRLENRNPEMK